MAHRDDIADLILEGSYYRNPKFVRELVEGRHAAYDRAIAKATGARP